MLYKATKPGSMSSLLAPFLSVSVVLLKSRTTFELCYFALFVCSVLVVLATLSVPVQVIDWKDSEMTYNLLMGTLNPTQSLTHPIVCMSVQGVIVSRDGTPPAGTVPLETLMSDDGSRFPSVTLDVRQDVAVICYSSGTTGLAKGVMLTHYNIVAMMAIFG